jgi:chloramphenicol 3-O-phosphotransferase
MSLAATDFPQVLVITGAMAAGKSSVAQAVAERLPHAVHLRGDAFRRMIVSGRVDPAPGSEAQWRAQLDLRYDLAVLAADRYARAGFTVIYQDILTDALPRVVGALAPWRPGVVVLVPSPEALAAREAARPKAGYKGGWTPEAFDAMVRAETPPIGLWLDTSRLSLAETVQAIFADLSGTRAGIAA